MTGYAEYLRALLRPLGVYALNAGSLSGAEIEALGYAFDGVSTSLDALLEESILQTAGDAGLRRFESLFTLRSVAETPKARRRALAALLRIGDRDFTLEAVRRAIQCCGVTADIWEHETEGETVVIQFPKVAGEPPRFQELKAVIEAVIPCHLDIEYRFHYLTWARFEVLYPTFAEFESHGHTWDSLERTVTFDKDE
ncbi:DUF2313 domain-containing protein [Oscillospiraceae bacterium OttesenSCG-928-F05]|nr:DUF2313 domain-containing protein [Oscillospiraceae bacterium OttesenSCG-928-F05]